jgi:hypothetical protein
MGIVFRMTQQMDGGHAAPRPSHEIFTKNSTWEASRTGARNTPYPFHQSTPGLGA